MSTVAVFDRRDLGATALGTLAGFVLVGGGLQIGTGGVGMPAGSESAFVLGALLLVSAVCTVAFDRFLEYATDPFVNRLFGLTQRSDRLRELLLPVVTNHAYVATALSIGVAYGLVLGVVLGVVAIPGTVVALGGLVSPTAVLVGVVAWTVYGVAVGGIYAVLTDRS